MADNDRTTVSGMHAGGMIPGTGNPVFAYTDPASATIPILVATPHAGRDYPVAILDCMRAPAMASRKLEDRYIDAVGLKLAQNTGAAALTALAPRAMLDLNREPGDVDWSMITGDKPSQKPNHGQNRRARSGLGIVPRRLPGYGEIWKRPLESEALSERLTHIHAPYHRTLGRMLDQLCDRFGIALLLDLHSMPPLPGPGPGLRGAQFIVGDRFGSSCAPELSASALACLSTGERSVGHNRPYAGGFILDRHAAPRRHIHAMQLEVCRTIYLDTRLDQPSARLPSLVRYLERLMSTLAGTLDDLGEGLSLRDAAE